MSYTVRIQHTGTGEIRTSQPFDFEFSLSWWTEGNFGCDCNRHLVWERAVDPTHSDGYTPTDCEVCASPCTEGVFRVLDATLEDGTVVPVDASP